MNFNQAVEYAKEGATLKRREWDKDHFLFYVAEGSWAFEPKDSIPFVDGKPLSMKAFLCFGSRNAFMPWLPAMSDIEAQDWEIT